MSTAPLVRARGLTKTFGATRALDGFDLTVLPGEVHGFLGPNGAGKSTAIRILMGMIRATSGEVRVFDRDPWVHAPDLHDRIGFVPGDVAVWPNFTGGQSIDLLLRMRGLDPADTRRDALVERFAFDPSRKGRTYSKGNRQKIALIAALAADVDLLVLDEPTSGLDPLMEQQFSDCLAEHVERGGAALLSSHILSEVDRLAERVTIIRDGRVVESGELADLRRGHHTRIRARFGGELADLGHLRGVEGLRVGDGTLECRATAEALAAVCAALAAAGATVLESTPPTLEDLFLDAYRGRPGART